MSRPLTDLSGLMNLGVVAVTPTHVEEVMTREVVTLSPNHSFQEAITLVARHRFRHLLVVDTAGRLAGVLSDRDLLRFMIREPHWDEATVAEVMKTDPVTVQCDTRLSTATTEMLSRRINCLPVVDEEGRVRGILTSTDLLKAFQQVQEFIERTSEA
jgi:CBS domain-containing protein